MHAQVHLESPSDAVWRVEGSFHALRAVQDLSAEAECKHAGKADEIIMLWKACIQSMSQNGTALQGGYQLIHLFFKCIKANDLEPRVF